MIYQLTILKIWRILCLKRARQRTHHNLLSQ